MGALFAKPAPHPSSSSSSSRALVSEHEVRRRRRERTGPAYGRASIVGEAQIGKSLMCLRVFSSVPGSELQGTPYTPTVGADFVRCRVGDDMVDVWHASGNPVFASVLEPLSRSVRLVIVCYSLADTNALATLADVVQRERDAVHGNRPMLLVGLRGDLPRAVTLQEVCAFAAERHICCFGSDALRLPIGYDDWASGKAPPSATAAASARGGLRAYSEPGASAVDWRAALRARWTLGGGGQGALCHAPVIEFSNEALTDAQAAWLRAALIDLAVENVLYDVDLVDQIHPLDDNGR